MLPMELFTRCYHKPAREILRDLVYYTNGYRLQPTAEFTVPQPYSAPEEDTSGRDTTITVYIPYQACGRQRGSKRLVYRRFDLGLLTPKPDAKITVNAFPFTLYGILDKINAAYGIQLTQDDVEDATFTTLQEVYPMTAKATSLAWSKTMNVAITTDLPALISVTQLDGFTAA